MESERTAESKKHLDTGETCAVCADPLFLHRSAEAYEEYVCGAFVYFTDDFIAFAAFLLKYPSRHPQMSIDGYRSFITSAAASATPGFEPRKNIFAPCPALSLIMRSPSSTPGNSFPERCAEDLCRLYYADPVRDYHLGGNSRFRKAREYRCQFCTISELGVNPAVCSPSAKRCQMYSAAPSRVVLRKFTPRIFIFSIKTP